MFQFFFLTLYSRIATVYLFFGTVVLYRAYFCVARDVFISITSINSRVKKNDLKQYGRTNLKVYGLL